MGNLNVQARDSVTQTTKQNGKQPVKEYSKDGKLWVGMTQKDAYLDDELSKLFLDADVNIDRVLDEDEIARYNGPTLVTSEKGTYYPGLQLEQVPQCLQEAFKEIDSAPRDGVIQENEIQEYVQKRKKLGLIYGLSFGAVTSALGIGFIPELELFDTFKIKNPAWRKAANVINKGSKIPLSALLGVAIGALVARAEAGIVSVKSHE